jgi:hypothetical protein
VQCTIGDDARWETGDGSAGADTDVPEIWLAPVFVTVEAPSTAKVSAEPSDCAFD